MSSRYRPATKHELILAIYEYMVGNHTHGDINTWDVSRITDMEGVFARYSSFNENIEDWDVSNVTNMKRMFGGCIHFNHPLQRWNVSNVTNMDGMFMNCMTFNQPLDPWNVARVTSMQHMFSGCRFFNQPLNGWNVANCTTFEGMFSGCNQFNQPLDAWNVQRAINMKSMFRDCFAFNQSLNGWNMTNVRYIDNMFQNCPSLSSSFANWQLTSVIIPAGSQEQRELYLRNNVFANTVVVVQPSHLPQLPTLVAPQPAETAETTMVNKPVEQLYAYYTASLQNTPIPVSTSHTFSPNATAFDVIEGVERPVREYLDEDPNNMAFVLGNKYYFADKATIRHLMRDGSVFKFPCKSIAETFGVSPSNLELKRPLFTLRNLGLYEGYVLYSQINELLSNPEIRVVALQEKERLLTVASLQMLSNSPNAVSASHCQDGQGGMLYEMKQIPGPYRGGRRRTRTRPRRRRHRTRRTRRARKRHTRRKHTRQRRQCRTRRRHTL